MQNYTKSGKGILTFGYIETERNKFYRYKSPISLSDAESLKVLVSATFHLVKKTINTSLVTCVMVIKLTHYMKCFLKQALM